jgi:formate hydrogenlyase regulatory protein HycA
MTRKKANKTTRTRSATKKVVARARPIDAEAKLPRNRPGAPDGVLVGEVVPLERKGDVPSKIPIKRDANYHTHYVGAAKQNGRPVQFMAFIAATLPRPLPKNWRAQKRWYAVVHRFDDRGRHLRTEAMFAGVTADGENRVIERARELRTKLLSSLEDISYGDVSVELFATRIEGHLFGLVDGSAPEEGILKIDLWPADLAFFAPWNGEYDT